MNKKTVIDRLYNEFTEIIEFFEKEQQISFLNTANSHFAKLLLISVASHFEYRITAALSELVKDISQENPIIVNFLESNS